MQNLAGNRGCDAVIRNELTEAGILAVEHGKPVDKEVPYSVSGALNFAGVEQYTFTRSWYYWEVEGTVPLVVAEVLYLDPVGRRDVRVAGHCGCPPPRQWAYPDWEKMEKAGLLFEGMSIVEAKRVARNMGIPMVVDSYHIDSQEGLNLFVQAMRQHGLVD